MNIGIFAPYYWPFEGGAERVARRVANELAGRHAVSVHTLRYEPGLPSLELDGPVQVIRSAYREHRPLGFTWMASGELVAQVRREPLNVLQIHGVTYPNLALAVCRAARSQGIPVIVIPHGLFEAFHGDPRQPLARRLLYKALVRPLLGALLWSASHIALTSPEERHILSWFRIPLQRGTVVYNGFEPPRPQSASGKRFRARHELQDASIILHVATIKPNKGHDVVIRALPQVLQSSPSARYVIVGKTDGVWGEYAQSVKALIDSLGLAAHVHMLGHLSDDELADAYASADIVVLPSLAETFPLAVLDGMAWGKPVVACDVGGVNHMIDDQVNGLIVKPGEEHQLAQALQALLSDEQRRQSLGAAAAATVRARFDWQQVIARYDALGEQLSMGVIDG